MRWLTVWCALAFSTAAALAAPLPLPPVNLVVQMRFVSEADIAPDDSATTTSTLTAPRHGQVYGTSAMNTQADDESRELRVLNGESASFRWSQSVPFQWMQAATAGTTAASGSRAGIVNAVTWLQAGQALRVQPHWPGGDHPVRLEVRLESERIDERSGDLPATSSRQSDTTLSVPMGRWTTLATTGSARPVPGPSAWSTQSAQARERQWIQVRVIEI
jgi:hypothetical protein